MAYQLVIDNVSGPVNVSNIAIDAAGNNVPTCSSSGPFLVGIFYRNSSGTVNRVTTRNQKGNLCGFGVYTESV